MKKGSFQKEEKWAQDGAGGESTHSRRHCRGVAYGEKLGLLRGAR